MDIVDVYRLLIPFLFISYSLSAQTLGGSTTFNFLKLPNTPQLTALGGIHLTSQNDDVGMAFNNPSLLRNNMHTQLNAVFNDMYASIKTMHLSFGYHHPKLNTNFAWGVHYFDYGEITSTDASGNVIGSLKPNDWVMQLSASRSYLEKWNYGLTFKYINSNYGVYRSNGIAFDAGLLYTDTANLITVSVIASNMGFQLKQYSGAGAEELPFDLQAGITKRLKGAPLSFSLTAHHIHRYDIYYNDTVFNNENGGSKSGGFDKFFRHFVLATQFYPIPQLEVSLGYNHLRRQELNIANTANGLNGFSMGVGLVLKKLQVRYARSQYQSNSGYNQLGLNLKFKFRT